MNTLAILNNTISRVTTVCAAALISFSANAQIIGGIEFPDGAVSFADAVTTFLPGPDVGAPHLDPARALGIPNGNHVSLGDGGTLILQFIDNSLTTSGDATPDLHIFEVGAVVEIFNLAISRNQQNWIDLGNLSGQPTSVDIDGVTGVVAGEEYNFVRLIDVDPNQTGSPFGEADIDAVGAISSAAPVPGGPTLALLGCALLFLRLAPVLSRKRR